MFDEPVVCGFAPSGHSPDFTFNSAISACWKGEQWQRALALFSKMPEAKLQSDVISYSAAISACAKGEKWQQASALLSDMWQAKVELDAISYSSATSACERASCLGFGGSDPFSGHSRWHY
ncbi:unnamed protein product [Prorocentrum cordatum]|uniref:Pentatricopeptide repeat-containing protein n=1 Tax=Prorocentrum cordatum TaxID=2364126 RepID=A0ABN9W6J4_9DINO|nr:unnamed protein product [Polarella glacialis]